MERWGRRRLIGRIGGGEVGEEEVNRKDKRLERWRRRLVGRIGSGQVGEEEVNRKDRRWRGGGGGG